MWILREIWKGEPWHVKVVMFWLHMKALRMYYWGRATGKWRSKKQ